MDSNQTSLIERTSDGKTFEISSQFFSSPEFGGCVTASVIPDSTVLIDESTNFLNYSTIQKTESDLSSTLISEVDSLVSSTTPCSLQTEIPIIDATVSITNALDDSSIQETESLFSSTLMSVLEPSVSSTVSHSMQTEVSLTVSTTYYYPPSASLEINSTTSSSGINNPSKIDHYHDTSVIFGIVIGSLALFTIIVVLLLLLYRKRKNESNSRSKNFKDHKIEIVHNENYRHNQSTQNYESTFEEIDLNSTEADVLPLQTRRSSGVNLASSMHSAVEQYSSESDTYNHLGYPRISGSSKACTESCNIYSHVNTTSAIPKLQNIYTQNIDPTVDETYNHICTNIQQVPLSENDYQHIVNRDSGFHTPMDACTNLKTTADIDHIPSNKQTPNVINDNYDHIEFERL